MTTAPADHLAPGTRRPAAEGTDPMDTSTTTREYWRAVVASGATALPRWSRERSAGDLGTQTVPVPTVGVGAVTRIAAALGVDVTAVLLAAHARVLAALTAEDEVLTLLAGEGGTVLPVRLDTGAATWRELITAAARAAAGAREHGAGDAADDAAAALAAVRTEVAGAWPETVLDPAGTLPDLAELAAGEALRVSWIPTGPDGAVLRVRHRTDVVDAGAADRIAGYHLTALAHVVTDLDATPSQGGLVGPAEARYSAEVLAGPVRELPDVRPHDLVRERARRHPDRPAVRRGEAEWSYRELDERSDAVARALLARGLRAEDVVAVVAERTLEWAAAVLGVLKAGGAYLPLEPHFPAGRIASVITRAESRLVLAERGSTTTLDEALGTLSGRERLLIDEAMAESHPDVDAHVAIGPDRLAYLYFTSGSTGEPKGAMCEHAGMLNHLLAKIEDLGVREGDVVAQTAPQCFDISLWQLVAGWLVGATTLLVEQEAVLDVPRFVDLLTAEHVAVAQLVPSYLDVVVSYLVDQPGNGTAAGPLADLRCLAVTGEAVKKELVTRWFAVRPDVTVVNAYGLTETSDDTNHAVMNAVPDGERVPLGPAVRNVRVDIVDPHLNPVPLGAPGEIVFSGVCVGRGYINDPDRTAAAFIADPEHPGMRRYRSGDHGRWLPTGDLDFLGRRDHQVKISGFRIEIGEIENTLLRADGVRDAAVVVAERPGRGKQLVGFYGSAEPIADATLREVLSSALPVYMVPPVIHHRDVLPLTANGKIDRKVLTALALELDDTAAASSAPVGPEGDWTPTERRLAEVWAPLLGVDEATISRGDHFFDRGASSLLAVKLAVRLGKAVTLAEITRHPVLTDLAALLDERAGSASSGAHAAPESATPTPSSAAGSTPASGQDEDPPTGPIVGLPLSGVPAPRGAEPPAPLLHELTSPSAGPRTVRHLVVGVPPAGAHAEAFRPLARALAGSPVAVLGVDLPGHDPTDDAAESAFEGVGELAQRLAGEVAGRATVAGADVVLWGHSAGTAIALATARELETRGVTVRRVLLGAQLPRTAAERRRDADALATTPDADLIPLLRGLGDASGADGGLDAPALRRAVAAYRHDAVHASRWIADALDDPASVRVSAPATVVVAADDPSTAGPDGSAGSGRAWAPLVGALTERVLPSGGHHFLLGDPRSAAGAVQDALALTPTG